MLFKLKRNPYGVGISSLPYSWLEVLAITPVKLAPFAASDGHASGFAIESLWTCRTEQGIVQIAGRKVEEEIALELFVDNALQDAKLRQKRQILAQRADLIEQRIMSGMELNSHATSKR